MEDNKNYERSEHLEDITDASMKDDYFNASRNIDRKYITIEGARENNLKNINVNGMQKPITLRNIGKLFKVTDSAGNNNSIGK